MLFVFHTKNSTAWGTAPWSSQGGPGLCVRICPLPQLHPAAAGTSETCAFSLKPSGSCQPQTQMLLLSSAVCSWRTKGRFTKAVMRIRSWNPIDLWWRLGVGALVAHQKLLSFFLVVRVAGPRMSLCCLLCSSGNRSCLETFVFGISHLVLKQRGSKDPKFRLGSLGPCCHCEVMWGERISSCYFEAAVSASICFVSWIVWGVKRDASGEDITLALFICFFIFERCIMDEAGGRVLLKKFILHTHAIYECTIYTSYTVVHLFTRGCAP